MKLPTRIPLHEPATSSLPDPPALDARLGAALEFIRGSTSNGNRWVVADVGTDHAYLPVVLLQRGLCSFAVATDIHQGPADVAAFHLASHGIGDGRAAVLLTDGLHGVEPYEPRDICIFGMGGEMIARIIEEAPWVKRPDIRLILQPMTRQDALRQYLDEHGFAIIAERMVQTDRIYQILCVEYDGIIRSHTPLQLFLGEQNMKRRDPLCMSYACRQKDILIAARAGKLQGSTPDTAREDALLKEIDVFLSDTP